MDLKPEYPADLGLTPELIASASNILHPFEKLLPVKVLDHIVYLPENNTLWRGLQFWGLVTRSITIDFNQYCIAGTCGNCRSRVQMPDADQACSVLLCQTRAEAGIHIKKLAPGFRLRKGVARPTPKQ